MTEPAATVHPIRFSADPPALIRLWRTLGLRRIDAGDAADTGDDGAEFAAASGLLGVHQAETADVERSAGLTALTFAVADVDAAADRLEAAGWATRVWDDASGRRGTVTHPAGPVIGLSAMADPGDVGGSDQRVAASLDVVTVWYSDDFAADAAFFAAFGFEPFGSLDNQWWCDLRAGRRQGGVIGLHGTGGGGPQAGGAGPARVRLGFETSEPLDALAARLQAAGYEGVQVVEDEAGLKVDLTDPDGQRLEIHPTI